MTKYFIDIEATVTILAETPEEAKEKLEELGLTEMYDYDIMTESEPRLTRYKNLRQAIKRTQP